MSKIIKNRSDSEMFLNYKEELTFEHTDREPSPADSLPRIKKADTAKDEKYLPKELESQIEKLLLELKLNLYKEGIVDYKLKASLDKDKIIISAIPLADKPTKAVSEVPFSSNRSSKKR